VVLAVNWYLDGRPAPLWPREIKRRENQKELAVSSVAMLIPRHIH